MSASVHIVAVAARTPVGLTAEESAASVRAGISRLQLHPFMVNGLGKPLRCARDGLLEAGTQGLSRLRVLATAVLEELRRKLGTLEAPRLLLVLPESRPGFSEADALSMVEALTSDRGTGSWSPRVELGGRGHAGVLQALEVAEQRLISGSEELCVVLGVDSYHDADSLDWLASQFRLAGEGARTGFIPGEAAAGLVLARSSLQRKLGLVSLARVRGVGTATETRLIHGDEEVLGKGLARAIQGATRELKLPDEALDSVYCDLNGERYRTEE